MGDRICQFYLRGKCQRSRCEFRHPRETKLMLENREADRRKQRERDELEEKRNGHYRHYSLSPDTARRPRDHSKRGDYSPKRRNREPESRGRDNSPRYRSRSRSKDRRRVDYTRLPVAETPCKFYLGSGCKFGLTCAFKHVKRHHLKVYRSRSRSPWRPHHSSRRSDSPYQHQRLSSHQRSLSHSPSPAVRHVQNERQNEKTQGSEVCDDRRSSSPRSRSKAQNEEVVIEDGGPEEKPGKVCSSVSPISIGKSPSPAGRQEKGRMASPIYWRSISPGRRKSEEKKASRSSVSRAQEKGQQPRGAAKSSKERRRSWSEDSAGVPKPGSRCRKCGQSVPE